MPRAKKATVTPIKQKGPVYLDVTCPHCQALNVIISTLWQTQEKIVKCAVCDQDFSLEDVK